MSCLGPLSVITVKFERNMVQSTVRKRLRLGQGREDWGMGTVHLSLWTQTVCPNSGTELWVDLLMNPSLLNSHYSLSGLRHQISLDSGEYINIYIYQK